MVLGHLQRGGGPSSADRVLALRFGSSAIAKLADGVVSGMVGMRNGEVALVPLTEAAGRTRTVPVDRGIVATARRIGICLGDEAQGCFSGG